MNQAEKKLVETGKRLKTRNLIEQASYTLNLAREDFTELEAVGLTQELLDSSNVLRNEIVNLEGAQESAKDNIPLQTLQVHDKIEEGKQWLKKSKLKAKRAFRLEEVKQHDFFSGPPVGVSVPRLIAALSKHIELHRKYTTDLAVYKGGVDFADEGEEMLQELQQIDSSQELSKTVLPQASYDLYYRQGVLFYNLKDINDMAEEVFINDTLSARKYHLDILKR